MTPQARCEAVLAAAPLLLPFVHGALARLLRAARLRAAPQAVTVGVVLAGAPVALLACWRLAWVDLPRAWLGWSLAYGASTYLGFGYAYFHLYNLTETGRRIRILDEFRTKGPMTLEELERRYAPEGMLRARLGRLVELGQARLEDGRYRLNGRVLLGAARVLAAFRRLLGFGDI